MAFLFLSHVHPKNSSLKEKTEGININSKYATWQMFYKCQLLIPHNYL